MKPEKIKFIGAMLIFGTIGVFVRYIPVPSSILAMVRGMIGAVFLMLVLAAGGKRLSPEAIRRNAKLLIPSGIAIGINWILLFEAYRYTTVAVATLCYYMAPVFVMALSPWILKEKLTGRRIVCILAALIGMVMISGLRFGAAGQSEASGGSFTGILLGLGAAAFYAGVMLMNKFMRDIPSQDMTVVQLASAAVVLLPYTLLAENWTAIVWTLPTVLLMVTVGIIHTGFAYWIYFSSIRGLSGQTIALLSYIDPAAAILLSIFFLGETMSLRSVLGAVLILGATLAA